MEKKLNHENEELELEIGSIIPGSIIVRDKVTDKIHR
jgi:hypothetical protein